MTNDDFFDVQVKQLDKETQESEDKIVVTNVSVNATEEDLNSDNITDKKDTSLMPPEAKKALVSLLRYGVILAAQKINLFQILCRYQHDIRHHLSNMYLKLILDDKMGVAYIESISDDELNADDETNDDEATSLITRRTLTLYDTLLLLVLRKHYQERETSGEQKVVIDVERIEANLTPFLALTNSSKSDRRKLSSALTKLHDKKIISTLRGTKDRFEITPIIRYVVNAEFLESLLQEYIKLAKDASDDADVPKIMQDE